MDFNRKETALLKGFKEKIEQKTFDENDACLFVIFLRSHISEIDYPYIHDFADSIAHRERNRGKAYQSMKNARENNYKTRKGSNVVLRYDGIDYCEWETEWEKLCGELDISVSKDAIKELLICLISALQFSEYCNLGTMRVLLTDNQLSIATVEDEPDSPYINYAVVNDVVAIKQNAPELEKAVFAKRIGHELQLIDEDGERVM